MESDRRHPSELYRTIHAQPTTIARLLSRAAEDAHSAARLLESATRIFVLGTGTSFHAAWVGADLLRRAGVDARALTHQEMALYPPALSSADAVVTISHRGSKRYGIDCIEHAVRRNVPLVGITGEGSPMAGPNVILYTCPQETSSTHTASYTSAMAALAMIAIAVGRPEADSTKELDAALSRIPEYIAGILSHEDAILPVALALAGRGRITFAGAGPNVATAREAALKVKESSYLNSEGFELETLLHGGLQALQTGDLIAAVAPSGPSIARTADLLRAADILGTPSWVVGDRAGILEAATLAGGSPALGAFEVERLPEALSPLISVVPFQLLACLTAEQLRTNPDSFREDDPVFARVSASYQL